MRYDNSTISASQENRIAVWDSGYKGVWHLSAAGALSVTDSTVNANNASVTGSVAAASGEIAGAAGGFASGIYLPITNHNQLSSLPTSDWTAENRVKLNAYAAYSRLIN